MLRRFASSSQVPARGLPWALAGLAIAASLSPAALHAQSTTYIWNGSTNNNWNNAANWTGGNPGNGAKDIIVDASTLDLSADKNLALNNGTTTQDRTVGTIIFGDTNAGGATAVNSWTLNPNSGSTPTKLIFAVTSGTGTLQVNNGTATINPIIAGTQGLTKTGAGTAALKNAGNTLTGGIFLQAGALSFVSHALGSNLVSFTGTSTLTWDGHLDDISSQILIGDGAVATLGVSNTAGDNIVFANALQTGPLGTGFVIKANAGNLTLTTANTWTGGTRVNNGRLILIGGDNRLSAQGALSFGSVANAGILQLGDATTGPSNQTVTGLSINGTSNQANNAVVGGAAVNSVFTINNAADIAAAQAPTFGGAGTNENNLALVKSGAGSLTLGKLSSFTGDVTLQGGSLILNSGAALGGGTKTVRISGTANAPSLQLNSTSGLTLPSTFTLRTSNDDATAPAILNVAGNNVIPGPLVLAEGGYGGGQTRISVQAGTLVLGGAISPDSSAATTRTLILDGAQGTAGFASGAISDAGNVKLALSKQGTGAWTLTGANTFSGGISIAAGSLTLPTAQTGGAAITVSDSATLGLLLSGAGQTLQTSSLTLGTSAGATLHFDLGTLANPSAPVLQTGALSTAGTSTVTISGTGLSVGRFSLIQYTGTIGGAGFLAFPTGDLPASALPARVIGHLENNVAASAVQLVISKYELPKWTGAQSNVWDINDGPDPTTGSGSVNWKESTSGLATRYLQGASATDSVIFDDTPGVSTNVVLGGVLTPTTVTVSATANQFTFSGAGKLSGATALLKDGASTLTLLNTGGNDFTGTTTIAAGNLQVGDGATAGAGQLGIGNVIANGKLVFFRPDDLVVPNVLSGTGTVQQNGAGVLTLSGNNSAFTGLISVSAGTLKLGSAAAAGTAASVQVSSGATLDLTGFTGDRPVLLNGGTLLTQSGTASIQSGNVTVQNAATAQVNTGTLLVTGLLGGSGSLNKAGTGTLTVTTNSAYSGGTNIAQGVLQIGASGGLGVTGALGSGDIAFTPGAGNTATLTILRADSALNVSQNITSLGAGTNSVIIGVSSANSPSGVVTFSGHNTFTGNVTINAGALKITNSDALGVGPKTVSIANSSRPSLYLDGSAGDITIPASISFTTSSDAISDAALQTAGAIVNLAGQNTIQGKIANINGSGGNTRLTAQGGTLNIAGLVNADGATGARTLLIGGSAQGVLSGVVADGVSNGAARVLSLQKDGTGTWSFTGSATYSGGTSVLAGRLLVSGSIYGSTSFSVSTGGTLELGASDVLNNSATLTLAGGLFKTAGFSEGDVSGNGLGNFSLTASSTIDLGSATGSTLAFAGLGMHTAGATLTILNWSAADPLALAASGDHLLFTGQASAFAAAYQQSDVTINGQSGYVVTQYDESHYELSIPEPSGLSLFAATAGLGLGTWRRRSPRSR